MSKLAASCDGSSSLHQQLKRATGTLHQRLEARLDLLGPQLSMHRYRQVLEAFYGFYAPVEVGLARLAAQVGFPVRARAGLLERDLVALGLPAHELAELPWCHELPPLACPEHLAGCLYVLEGACLGGQVVARALQRRIGVVNGRGASFFVGDADGTAARWLFVLAWLEGLVHAGTRTEPIVASACETFLAFTRWLEEQKAA